MSNQTAMIVEDDANSAKILAHFLAKEGIETNIITDVSQVDSHIDSHPDMVFLDLQMPHRNGYEVLADLLDDPHYQTIPIIASSVYNVEIPHLREAGFHSFIGKPLAKEKFQQQLQRILAGEHIWELA